MPHPSGVMLIGPNQGNNTQYWQQCSYARERGAFVVSKNRNQNQAETEQTYALRGG